MHHFHLTMPHTYSVSCNKSYEKFLLLMKLTWFIEIYIVWNETILWPQWQGIFWSEMITSHKMAWIFVVVHTIEHPPFGVIFCINLIAKSGPQMLPFAKLWNIPWSVKFKHTYYILTYSAFSAYFEKRGFKSNDGWASNFSALGISTLALQLY